MTDRFLRIYMNDQLAAGVLWRGVARRAQRNNAGTEAAEALERVARAIAEDVATFAEMMDRLGLRRSPVKPAAAIAAERGRPAGGQWLVAVLFAAEPLRRTGLAGDGVEGKKILWQNLRDYAGLSERLPDVDFDGLIERAQSQRDDIERQREAAGRAALARRASPR